MENEFDRVNSLDNNFLMALKKNQLPETPGLIELAKSQLTAAQLIDLFDSQITNRHLDFQARLLQKQNKGFYTIASAGHEANAAIALAARVSDMAFLHYRSGAFYIQRAKQQVDQYPIHDILLSLMASRDDPIASGRHKVFGSKALNIPPQTSTIASHLPKALGAALAIYKAKMLNHPTGFPEDSVALCSFGDASANHSTAQGAFNCAEWLAYSHVPLPLIFICEDNGLGLSVETPKDWIATTYAAKKNMHYLFAHGTNILDVYVQTQRALAIARTQQQPVFLHIEMVRLLGHAGSDIETVYLTEQQLQRQEYHDPLLHTANILLQNKVLTAAEILQKYMAKRDAVQRIATELMDTPHLTSAADIMASIIPPQCETSIPEPPSEAARKVLFSNDYKQLSMPRNMSQMLNIALADLMLQYPSILLFGEDVATKGGVYHVTAGLKKKFNVHRIYNTLLDEQEILGTGIGLAHYGFLPIVEIQFLAFLYNAIDQIRGEAATLPFFSNGQFTNPMVIRIPGLAYQKGFGGHFHNENALASLRDIPGLIIAVPSNGGDAVKMLRHCVRLAYQQQRLIVFLEPIALYMTKDLHEPGDKAWLGIYPEQNSEIRLGEINVIGDSKGTAIVSYGNGFYLACQAAKILQEKYNREVKLIDLRWLTPLPMKMLLIALQNVERVIIVDECRKTGSVSEEIMTLLVENLQPLPQLKRITAEDSFIPLGPAANVVLPSCDAIIQAIIAL